jgi:hypothetical protein
MTRFTTEHIDKLKQRGLRVTDTTGKVEKKPNPMYALGRMKSGAMNKTEAAYFKYLQTLQQTGEVIWFAFEPMNLKLADKCFYRVDFMVMLKSGQLECHEVKGFWTDDALVKIKTAAVKFPFRFISVKLSKGVWEMREF